MPNDHSTAARGTRVGISKLNEDKVRAARAEHVYRSPTHGTTALANKYGVSRNAMHKALNWETWFHVHP